MAVAVFVGGAALGAVFGEGFAVLHDAVKNWGGKVLEFKSVLKSLKSNLDLLAPVVEDISRLNRELGLPEEETKRLIKDMKKAEELILTCSATPGWKWNYTFQAHHSKQLTELDKDIAKLCQVHMPAQTKRDTLQILHNLEDTSQTLQMVREEIKALREENKLKEKAQILITPSGQCGKTTTLEIHGHDVLIKDSIIKTNMKSLGNEMSYYGGLPLAMAVLGGLLVTKQTHEEWENVHRHVKSYLNVQKGLQFDMFKVLDLSYNDLPYHLKQCFLYIGIFPQDFEIYGRDLVYLWMAEGFIQQIQHERGIGDTMEDVGERYLQELVQRCLVLVVKFNSHGRIETCRMHDLMHEFCESKSSGNFSIITNIRSTNICSMNQIEAQLFIN